MKKFHLKGFLLAVLCCLWLTMSCAMADEAPVFWLMYGEEGAQTSIIPQSRNDKNMLYLPGSWNGEAVTIHTADEEGVYINGELYHSGDAAPLFENGETVTYRRAGKKQNRKLTAYIGSDLPALFLTLAEEDLTTIHKSKEDSVPASLVALRADGTTELSAAVDGLKTRGNTTMNYPKKPYQIKLESKFNLFGLGKSKKFILLADYLDISLLRNRITYNMAQASGMPHALSCLHADVYINGEYRGLYLLTEKIEIGDDAVPLHALEKETEELNDEDLDSYDRYDGESEGLRNARWYDIPNNPEDITGGYILETDKVFRYREETDAGFITGLNMAVYIKEPEYPSQSQTLYIAGLVNAFHRAVTARDGVDPETGVHYSDMIDMPSFARKFLIEEVTKNFDALRGSQYFFKDRGDDLLYAGPAWDYDLAYGNIRQEGFIKHSYPNGFYLSNYSSTEVWYNNLIAHEDFEQLVMETYRTVFHPMMEVLLGLRSAEGYEPLKSISDYKAEIADSAAMNFVRWNPSSIKDYNKDAGTNFRTGVEHMNDFIQKRMNFLDKEWME